MTRLRLLIIAFQLATPVFAAWALCEVAVLFVWGTAIGGTP